MHAKIFFFLPEHGHLKNHAATIIEIKYNVLKVLEEPFGDTTKKRGGQKSQFFSEKNFFHPDTNSAAFN